jgi:flagellar basal-body rod protein FlgC
MGMFDSMHVSASGLAAERLRMDVIAQNLANANSTRGPDGQPYRRHEVIFRSSDVGTTNGPGGTERAGSNEPLHGVEPVAIVEDPSALRTVYDPQHPDADEDGYVHFPNVNPVTEMVDMMTATRAYEANVTAMNAAKNMALKALDILR